MQSPNPPVNLAAGSTLQFTATGTYSNGSTANITSQVTWASSNTTIANITSSGGLATGEATGTTYITASLSGVISPGVTLNVLAAIQEVTIYITAVPQGSVNYSYTGSDGAVSGSITLPPTSNEGELEVTSGTQVRLVAVPPTGYNFVSWGGTVASSNPTISLVAQVSPIPSVTATFAAIKPVPLAILTGAQLPNAEAGVPYSLQIVATGGTLPYTWSVFVGPLPPGLSILSSGLVSGTPLVSDGGGVYAFTVQVQDDESTPQMVQHTFLLDITQSIIATWISLNPNPIATATSLAPGATVSVDLYALNGDQVQVIGGTVYLAFTPTTGGGSALVGSVALTSTPSPFITNSSGNIIITYTTPTSLPSSGMDILQAYTALSGGNSVADGYSFSGPSAAAVTDFSLLTQQAYRTGIATAPDGSLWFGEQTNGSGYPALGHITISGNINVFPLPSGDIPTGILVDPSGNVWFTDCNKNAIGELIPSTGSVQEFPTPTWSSHPIDMVLGPDGAIWFSESNQDNIGRITESGSITEYQVGPQGSGAGVNGIATGPDGNIWFTDFDTGDIGRFNPSTKQVSLFPLPTPNHLYEISGICSGPGDMMWFVGIDGVASITLNGTITEYGLPGSGFGSDYPVPYTSIVVGPDGNLWTQLGNIFEISPQGNYTEMTAPATPNDMTIGSDGNLWFTDCVRNIVGRIAITPIMPDQITISPSPIAPKGSLTPGQTVNVVIKATSIPRGWLARYLC